MNPLSFKYKLLDGTEEEYKESSKKYHVFLKKISNKLDTDLIDFFGFDFFHDGKIEDINITDAFKEISFRIFSPNLKLFDEDGDFIYVNAYFKCHLYNVPWFNSETVIERKNDSEITYLYSEINTLKEEIAYCRKYDRRPYQSLLIKTTQGFLGFVFENIWVEPEEPLAFELLLKDKRNRELLYNSDFDV